MGDSSKAASAVKENMSDPPSSHKRELWSQSKAQNAFFISCTFLFITTDLSDVLAPAQKLKAALRSAARGGEGGGCAGLPYHLEHLECIQSHSLGPRAQGSDS